MTVLIYNDFTNRMETYHPALNAPMPYNNSTLTVREFRGSSSSQILWTTRATMTSWVNFRAMWGSPIHVPYAFRRIGEGGHTDQSQHYAGVSFDVGQNLNNATRTRMRTLAASSGLWSYVEPVSLTPTWVHFDRRYNPPACPAGGFPILKNGSVGNYVCTLQDALVSAGFGTIGIDGYFGPQTEAAVRAFQRARGLVQDGVVGCASWTRLTRMVNGIYTRARNVPRQYMGE